LPLVADFRDPWTYGFLWNPRNKSQERTELRWERYVLKTASNTVFTSPLTMAMMAERYPQFAHRFCTITNGFDEEDIHQPVTARRPSQKMKFSFVGRTAGYRHADVLLDAFAIIAQRRRDIAA